MSNWHWQYNEDENELEFWADGVKYVRVLEFHGEAYAVRLRAAPFSKGELEILTRSGLEIWHEHRWEEETYMPVDKEKVTKAGRIFDDAYYWNLEH